MEALYAHYPGLIVMTPATVEDAYSMLLEAVSIDDPVIFCEHKYLYYHLKAESLPSEALPTGKARIARQGRDATVVTYSAMLHESLACAEELAKEGWEIEVIDLRSHQAARHRHRPRLRRADRPHPRRRRSLALGRRHRGNPGPRRHRRLRPPRRPPDAPQRQRHAGPLSPEPLGHPPPHRPNRRDRLAPTPLVLTGNLNDCLRITRIDTNQAVELNTPFSDHERALGAVLGFV